MHIAYLITYGSSGFLGRFVPRNATQSFRRNDRVVIRSERGKELGTVLTIAEELALPASLRHVPGEILGLAEQADENAATALAEQTAAAFGTIRSIADELSVAVQIVDLEAVADPLTYVVHLLRLGDAQLQPLQVALTERLQAHILLHDITDPVAIEEQAESGCGSCGSEGGGCSSKGGCANGSCGSGCGTSKEFSGQWKAYFAELREQMETRKKQTV